MGRQRSDQIFRKEALDHLSTPDQLDQLLRVVTLKSWIPLGVIAGGIFMAGVWGVVGRVPVTVEGHGLLIRPRGIIPFQSPAAGEIVEFRVSVGDEVEEGQELGRINQPDVKRRLEQEEARLEELETQRAELAEIWEKRIALEEEWVGERCAGLEARVARIQQTASRRRGRSTVYFEQQGKNLSELRQRTDRLCTAARKRYEKLQELAAAGNATPQEVTEAQTVFYDYQMKLEEIEVRKRELELQEIEARAWYEQQMDLVAELKSKADELQVELQKSRQLERQARAELDLDIQAVRANIVRLQKELVTKERIVADYSGRVVEITAAVGQMVLEGQRLGSLETRRAGVQLEAVAYYNVADGKQVAPGMSARISPATVQRERYGSIIGRVFSVSPFPVTTDAVTNTVGNAEVARRLTSDGDKIKVVAVLEEDPTSPSGFRWTSGQGPQARVTAGTTVSMRTTVESRRPVSYLIPFMRQWGVSEKGG